jgi:hypothetical protein
MILVGDRDREFSLPPFWYVNSRQVSFRSFRLVVLWQFYPFQGGVVTKSVLPKTFHPEEIALENDLWTRLSMAQMAVGVSEMYARDLFTRYKYDLANTLLDFQWNAASEVEKNQFSDMREALKSFDIYTLTGVPFSPEHAMVLKLAQTYALRIRKRRLLLTEDRVQGNR